MLGKPNQVLITDIMCHFCARRNPYAAGSGTGDALLAEAMASGNQNMGSKAFFPQIQLLSQL
jgi:hypothetical protein